MDVDDTGGVDRLRISTGDGAPIAQPLVSPKVKSQAEKTENVINKDTPLTTNTPHSHSLNITPTKHDCFPTVEKEENSIEKNPIKEVGDVKKDVEEKTDHVRTTSSTIHDLIETDYQSLSSPEIKPENHPDLSEVEDIERIADELIQEMEKNSKTLIEPSILLKLKEAKKMYDEELDTLYQKASPEQEQLLMRGIGFSPKQSIQMRCSQTIDQIERLLEQNKEGEEKTDHVRTSSSTIHNLIEPDFQSLSSPEIKPENHPDLSEVKDIQRIANELVQEIRENSKTPIKPSILLKLKEAKKMYVGELKTLYEKASPEQNVELMRGIGFSPKQKIQRQCVQTIGQIRSLLKENKEGDQTYTKGDLARYKQWVVESDEFRLQMFYSLQDPKTLSLNDREEFKKVEGTTPYSAELFFDQQLKYFIYEDATVDTEGNVRERSPHTILTPDEESTCKSISKAFEFNTKMNWKASKQTQVYGKDYTWNQANTGAAFQYAIKNMKPGEEIVLTGTHRPEQETGDHAVLLVFKKLGEEGPILYRKINTGFGSISGSSYTKTVVDQSLFTTESLLSDEFASIVTEELLNFKKYNAKSDLELFPRFENFTKDNKIPENQIEVVLEKPEIPLQVVGNCAIASKLAYMRLTMGDELFEKFADYTVENDLSRSKIVSDKIDLKRKEKEIEIYYQDLSKAFKAQKEGDSTLLDSLLKKYPVELVDVRFLRRHGLKDIDICYIIKNIPLLTKLKTDGLFDLDNLALVPPEGVGLPTSLREIDCSQDSTMDDIRFKRAIQNCTNLEVIDIRFTNLTLNETTLPSSLKIIKCASTYKITDENFKKAVAGCMHLEEADITDTNISYSVIPPGCKITGFTDTDKEKIYFQDLSDAFIAKEEGDSTLLDSLLKKYPGQLVDVQFLKSQGFEDRDICYIIKNIPLITKLDIHGTSFDFDNLALVPPEGVGLPTSLREIDCGGAYNIDDIKFNRAIQNCTNLEVIDIGYTNLTLEETTLPSSLKIIKCAYNSVITDENFKKAIAGCTDLEEADITSTNISHSVIPPGCKITGFTGTDSE